MPIGWPSKLSASSTDSSRPPSLTVTDAITGGESPPSLFLKGVVMSADPFPLGAAYAGREANTALSFRQFNKSKHAQYFTPVWLADLLFECLRPFCPHEDLAEVSVLDPTCGSGRLLAPWKTAGATVLGIELDALAAKHAVTALGPTNVRTGDLLDYRSLLSQFSLVVTNPPYGLYWTPPDPKEAWVCKTSGGLLESQGATLEVCAHALAYGGLLVAIVPTSSFTNAKDNTLRTLLYDELEGLLQLTLPQLFAPEYRISIEVDLLVARKTYRESGEPWRPRRLTATPDTLADTIRQSFRRLLETDEERLPASTPNHVPVLSRLLSITPSTTVRLTPKGVTGSADVQGLLQFLDATVTAFDPIRGIEHGLVSATLSPASLVTLGPAAATTTLSRLGFLPTLTPQDAARLTSRQAHFTRLRTPVLPPRPHQRLAYLEERPYEAQATVVDDATPLFTCGRAYLLRPSWVRHRDVAKVENVFDESIKKFVEITTSVDRGFLAFRIVTDSGLREFREISVDDVQLLTDAFALPEVSDLEIAVPKELARLRRRVAQLCPFLFPFQQEDVARLAIKPFGYLGYEQGGGKTVTAAAWAAVRGFQRVLVVCPSALVDNWLHELADFGFSAERLTSHTAVNALQSAKRAHVKPTTTAFFVTSYEFLALAGARRYDLWTCRVFLKDGELGHEVSTTAPSCPQCSRAYSDVVTTCPSCNDADGWTGGSCHACGYQAWTVTSESHQWPAYKRLKKLFGAVLLDEAQLAKSKNTRRGRAVRAFRPKGRLVLTGTLMKGYPIDVFWNVAWLLGFDTPLFPYPYRGGAKRFLDEFGTYQFVSRQFEETLHEGRAKLLPEVSNLNRFWRLLGAFTIRRKKDDIYALPEKRRTIYVLPLDSDHRTLYDEYADWAAKEIETALHLNPGAPNMGIISNALWKLRYAATCPVAVDILNRRRLQSDTWNKLEKIRMLVQAAAARGEKVLVYSALRTMVTAIVRHLRAAGLGVLPITADVPTSHRFALIQDFSANPHVPVLVAGLNCLNRGFTITAANHVVLVDLEYSPEATDQAEDRVHRPGQTRVVEISYLLSKDTIDGVIHDILLQKAEAIRHAIDGRARFTDVADLLKSVTGDVQLEIAKRIAFLPPLSSSSLILPPQSDEMTGSVAASLTSEPRDASPDFVVSIQDGISRSVDLEAEANRRRLWDALAAERRAAKAALRRPVIVVVNQSSLFD